MAHSGGAHNSTLDHSAARYSFINFDQAEDHRGSEEDRLSRTLSESVEEQSNTTLREDSEMVQLPRKPESIQEDEEKTAIISRWGVGWKVPALMYGFYLCALVVAMIHLGFFMYMNGRLAVGDHVIPQTYISAASQLLSRLFSASLCASLAVAFSQHLWRVLRTNSVKVSNIELLYSIRDNVFLMTHPGPIKTAPLLFLTALVSWLIPIAAIYPPGALIVDSVLIPHLANASVPYFDPSSNWGNTTNFNGTFSGPAVFDSRQFAYMSNRDAAPYVAKSTLLSGNILPSLSPCGPNCAFDVTFNGPYLQCNSPVVNYSQVTYSSSPAVISADWTSNVHFSNVIFVPVRKFPELSINISTLIGYPQDDFGFVVSTTQINCMPSLANYTLRTTYVNGNRQLSPIMTPITSLNNMWNSSTNFSQAAHFPGRPSASNQYAAINTFSLIDSVVKEFSGTVNGSQNMGYDYGRDFNFTLSNGTVIQVHPSVYNVIAVNSSVLDTIFNVNQTNYTRSNTWPVFNVTEASLNDVLMKTSLNYMYGLGWLNTTVAARVSEARIVYSFAAQKNLLVPYFLSLAVAVPFLVLGGFSLYRNGVSAIDGGFVQTLMTTTGSKTLERAAAGGCLGGTENVPKELRDMKIRFGELITHVGHDGVGEVRRAGFGTEDEIIQLDRNARYGIL